MANYELASKVAYLRKISKSFVNYRGIEADVPFENIELILAAMGYDLNDDQQLNKVAYDLEAQQWLELLEPVSVLSPLRDYWGINIHVKEQELNQTGHWRITLENGSELDGSFDLNNLTQTGESTIGGTQYVQRIVPLAEDLPLGYHSIDVTVSGRVRSSPLIVTPKTGYQPKPMVDGDKVWGSAIQLYTLRSENNWGMGDFSDLAELIELLASQGADVIGLNPIHALYPVSPEHASPYSPSNRSFLNVLYTDILAVPEFTQSPALKKRINDKDFQAAIAHLRSTDDVEYSGVSALKFECFESLYAVFKQKHLGTGSGRDQAFDAFMKSHGEPLHTHAVFEALLAYFKAKDINAWGWPVWPEEFQNHQSEAVERFARENEDSVNYWKYLQFITDEQLQSVDALSKHLGMKIGLYRDLAVGADRGGAEVWGNREVFCLDAAVGAPPDTLGPKGQNWGLPPLDPLKLKEEGYSTFITLLRNNMRACGALRIDHAMALLRLWWCPPGETAAKGAYVYYDLFDMLGILNLESNRNQCMVIAEDLGTVPEAVLESFPKAELYSNKVFYFEIDEIRGCTPPSDYAEKALAIVCNHDMPTVKAYWNKSDLDLRMELGMFGCEEDYVGECEAREIAKMHILKTLHEQKRLPSGIPLNPSELKEMTLPLSLAIHKHLASSRSQIVAIQLEDMMLINKPVNVPGTSTEYSNWRRKLDTDCAELIGNPDVQAFFGELNSIRKNV